MEPRHAAKRIWTNGSKRVSLLQLCKRLTDSFKLCLCNRLLGDACVKIGVPPPSELVIPLLDVFLRCVHNRAKVASEAERTQGFLVLHLLGF